MTKLQRAARECEGGLPGEPANWRGPAVPRHGHTPIKSSKTHGRPGVPTEPAGEHKQGLWVDALRLNVMKR